MEVSLLPHPKNGNMRSSPCAAEEERCERPDKSFWSICDRDTFEWCDKDEPPPRPFLALESQREQWWTGAALCHRSLEFWPQRLRRKVRGRGLSPPTKSPMFSMNLSAPVVAKAEADAGAYTVGQAAHDLELLRSPATDLPTGQYNVGGTGECAGRVHGGPLPG